ncbi:X2-like carbohydrate binding domain-containing protein [Paenibacillus sp. 2KB_20]|uniref:X2-like carbohydrate binding domain-containing protein n=1 Tax=Paenibacillus sp. 2KB_20 TaxID=3232977 RepID=UPI003F965265
MKLELNGNELKHLTMDWGKLKAGNDYLLEGDILTLKAQLLKLFDDRGLGTKGKLIVGFNRAVWSVPNWTNRREPHTTEAVYANGENDGPSD